MESAFPTPYPIIIEPGSLARLGAYMAKAGLKGTVYIISDDRVAPLYAEPVQTALAEAGFRSHLYQVPSGEVAKSLEVASQLYDWLAQHRAERKDSVLALGGGVTGDLAGFVASTFLRGMRFVQVPTTVLAMVDASVGGKVAVNHPRAKNLIGSFYMPDLVVMDPTVLSSLPQRELAAGWAEIIKHGFIMDPAYLDLVEQELTQADPESVPVPGEAVLSGSVRLKAEVVAEDPKEQGRRIILNYGHTLGHAIEATGGYGKYLHGEAVAIGMQGEGRLSALLGLLENADAVLARQTRLLQRARLPLHSPGLDSEKILDATRSDKKVESTAVRWVLLKREGAAIVRHGIDDTLVRHVLNELTEERTPGS